MPRRIRSSTLETRTARLKLAQQRKPYWIAVAPGISLGYRRNAGAGAWNVRAADGKGGNWIKGFAHRRRSRGRGRRERPDFWQAADKAKALARGRTPTPDGPRRVDEALTDYAADLAVRGANPTNATQPRHHLTPALLSKPVSMLTVRELRHWRNGLHQGDEGQSPSTASARRSRPRSISPLRTTTGSPTPRHGRSGLPRSPRTTTPKAIWC